MTNEQSKKMFKAKLECLKRETSGTDFDCNRCNCDECSLNYEQGNVGEQKETLDMAIKALEQQQDKIIHNHPCEDCYYNDGDVHAECVICNKAESEDEEMLIAKYPEWVEAQLKMLDEKIEEIYREYAEIKVRPDEAMRIKEKLYELTKPFVDEKVRLIANSCPTYIMEGAIKKSEDEE